ncbi:MAG TPA: prolyl oligopeptidase family serine peptidase [Woeseiaceae bacterium]|nr:prolyl oligopeptidase family serine peptidase [Woeseiaceae bacterium]
MQSCNSTSVFENGACRTFALRIDARAPTPFTESGTAVSLEVVLFKPLADGRFPTLVFNHGSTGDGSDPAQFDITYTNKAVAQFFVERGFIVAFPQRRGRGQSGGTYDEGFNAERSAYSCEAASALAGAERALADLDVAVNWLRDRADVDTTQLYVGGTSRGGILSLVHAANRPDIYSGAMNFVGGWLGEPCGDYDEVNKNLFTRAAANPGPTIWLYGRNDSFYSIEYSRSNHEAFAGAGGSGAFHEFTRAAGLDGHFVANDPALWGAAVDDFLEAP